MTVSIVLASGALMMLIEHVAPARRHGPSQHWWVRAAGASALQALIAATCSPPIDHVFATFRAWPTLGARLGTVSAALLGYFVITFVYYFWHRARHEVAWLWRVFHQLHHSPERLEVITSFYKHPLEMLANAVLTSLVLCGALGVSAEAATLTVLLTGLAELFYHWNVRTPRWLGYVIQRPESHRVHHARGRHCANYSDLPLWDWLFGTLDNPRVDTVACGFERREELRIAEMLVGRDVVGTS